MLHTIACNEDYISIIDKLLSNNDIHLSIIDIDAFDHAIVLCIPLRHV